MRKTIILDGNKFSDWDGFYTEFEKVMTKDLTWHIGRYSPAFNDVLWGGFGVFDPLEPIAIVWINFSKSRKDFDEDILDRYLKSILDKDIHDIELKIVE
jgi:RNAse (barnase) inhibitor barstar